MEISRKNVKQLADRSPGNPPLVMPPVGRGFVANQLKKDPADVTVEDRLNFAERCGYVPYMEVYYSPLINDASRRFKH